MTAPKTDAPVFPRRRADPFTPPAEYQHPGDGELRKCPLAYGGDAWLVSGYHATRAILADNVNFSADNAREGFPAVPLASKRPTPGHFLTMDPPEHGRLRQLVTGEFTPGRIKQIRPRMAAAVSALVDRFIDGGSPADLVAGLSVPLPAVTSSELLGTPLSDLDFFLDVVRGLQTFGASPARQVAAAGRITVYLRKAITDARREPRGDLLSTLARELDGDRFSLDELVGIANLIIIAGLETTAGLMSLTVLSLLKDPRQGDLVRADPGRWAGPAVAEALRYWTLIERGIARVAVRPVEVAGQSIRPGDAIMLSLVTANRDPAVFPAADTFDITRDARPHLAFGHGLHRCLGAPVALAQTEIAVAELFVRLPGLRLAVPIEELSFLDEMLVYGLRTLPVAW